MNLVFDWESGKEAGGVQSGASLVTYVTEWAIC